MEAPAAFLVHIFMPDGDPEGVRVIEKSNWSGEGLAFPRQLYSSKVSTWQDRRSLTPYAACR